MTAVENIRIDLIAACAFNAVGEGGSILKRHQIIVSAVMHPHRQNRQCRRKQTGSQHKESNPQAQMITR